jgi:hypothetical protein
MLFLSGILRKPKEKKQSLTGSLTQMILGGIYMKKLIAVLMLLALVTTAAVAQVTFTAWGRVNFVPIWYDGDTEEIYSSTHVNWGSMPYLTFNIGIGGEQIGLAVTYDFAVSAFDGPAHVWWQPNSMFRVSAGWARDDSLRGADVVSTFHSYIGGFGDTNDPIFHRSTTTEWWLGWPPGPGAVISVTPNSELTFIAALNTKNGNPIADAKNDWGGGFDFEDITLLEDMLKDGLYSLGYAIPDLGLFRAGYFGRSSMGNELIQAAFRLDAVQGLLFDIGFGYSLVDDGKAHVALAYGQRFDLLYINAGLIVDNLGSDDPMNLALLLNPRYYFDFGTLGTEILVKIPNFDDVSVDLGFALTYSKDFSGGIFKTGVAVNLMREKPVVAIPLEFTYSIF